MIISEFYRQYKAHRDSSLSLEDFILKYSEDLKKVRIGCSFNPEHWRFEQASDSPLAYHEDSKLSKEQMDLIMASAKFLVEDLKVKDIRLSIRWSKIWSNNTIDFNYYSEIFKYFFSQDINICLNVGPIKTMRWPEEQVPKAILKELKNPPQNGSIINKEAEIASIASNYLNNLLKFLKTNFEEKELDKISCFQLDNECFNRFGEHSWVIHKELETQFISEVHKEFPRKNILINSSGRNDMRRNLELIELTGISPSRFILGYNFYFKVPYQAEKVLLRLLDNLNLSRPGSLKSSYLKQLSFKNGFRIEVTELQGEPWLGLDAPGNSLKDFQYSILRSIFTMLNLDYEPATIRYWGIEELIVKKLKNQTTEEHNQIFAAINLINSNS